MCQAYEGEARWVDWAEKRDAENGKPSGCSFQAGYFQCPNKYNKYAVQYGLQKPDNLDKAEPRVWGWTCKDCGSFYPELNGH